MKKNTPASTPKSGKKGGQSSLLSFFSPVNKNATSGPASSPLKSKSSNSVPDKKSEVKKPDAPLSPTKPDRVNRQENGSSANQKRDENRPNGPADGLENSKTSHLSSDGSESLPTPGSDGLSSPSNSQSAQDETVTSLNPPSSPVTATSGISKRVRILVLSIAQP